MANQELFEQFAEKVSQDFDAGEIFPSLKGKPMSLWLNPPGIVRSMFYGKTDSETGEQAYKRYREVVAIMYELDPALVQRLSDSVVLAAFNFAWSKFLEYEDTLRKN